MQFGTSENVLETIEFGFCGIPNLHCINVRPHHVLKMRRYGMTIYLRSVTWSTHSFGNVKNNACEPVLVDPDLLSIGYLTQFTFTYLWSAATKDMAELLALWSSQTLTPAGKDVAATPTDHLQRT